MKSTPPDPGSNGPDPEDVPEPHAPAPLEQDHAHAFAADPMPEADTSDGDGLAPAGYGEDSIAAVPRGPHSVFVHWEVGGPGSARLRERLGDDCPWRLRLTDEATGRRAEVTVDPDAGNYYLDVRPGGRYVVELGVVATGTFLPVCRSAECTAPPQGPSPDGPVVWARFGVAAHDGQSQSPQAARAAPWGATMPGLTWDPDLGGGSSGLPGEGRDL